MVEHVYGFVESDNGEFHLGFYVTLTEDHLVMKSYPQIFAVGDLVGIENLGCYHCGFSLDLTVYVSLHSDWDLPLLDWTQMPERFLVKVAQIFLLDWNENGCQLQSEHFLQLMVYHQILDLNLSGNTMVF